MRCGENNAEFNRYVPQHTQNLPQNVKAVLSIEGGEGDIFTFGTSQLSQTRRKKSRHQHGTIQTIIKVGALESDENRVTDPISGKTVVAEMNKIGMFIDVSHLNRKSFYDIAKVTKC